MVEGKTGEGEAGFECELYKDGGRRRGLRREEKDHARKGLGCACLCLGCTQGCCLMTAGLDTESASCEITRWKRRE